MPRKFLEIETTFQFLQDEIFVGVEMGEGGDIYPLPGTLQVEISL